MAPLTGDPAAQTDRPRVEDAVHSPEDIAARLRLPPPTQEQAEVVTAPLTPRLVLAGAGSGKTATMADRVVWLVANGLVRPDEVLGVTFTRKASGELAERINGRVDALLRSGLEIPGFDGEPEDLGRASVSTYHSYAGALVRDHGLRIGVEPEARLLGGADAHRLMGAVVRSHPVVADTLGVAPSRLITQALRLAGDMAEHLVSADEVREFLARLAEQGSALPLPPRAKTPSKEIQEFLTGLADRALMADLVARYDEVKREQDVMDFGDLLRHAARIAVEVPAAGEQERARFPVVLLDEFQDTSHAQMRIFAGLFGPRGPEDDAPGLGHCVTAVGDPHQSIYGFRGASAGQLFAFPHAFPRLETGPGGAPRRVNADVSHLTIAWRNEESILAVANAVAAPLNAHAAATGGAPVEVRTLRPRPGAGEGVVRVDRFVTAEEEAADVVARLGALTGSGPGGTTPSRAVLCRTRAQFGPVLDALDAAGLPYEVLGLSGLLALPEVAEVLAVLHVLADPTRSDQLVRLLTGPRWRIGVADLEVLQERARFVSRLRARRAAGGREDPAGDAPARHRRGRDLCREPLRGQAHVDPVAGQDEAAGGRFHRDRNGHGAHAGLQIGRQVAAVAGAHDLARHDRLSGQNGFTDHRADVVGLGAGGGQFRRRLGDTGDGVGRLLGRIFRDRLCLDRRRAVGNEDRIDLVHRPVFPGQVSLNQTLAGFQILRGDQHLGHRADFDGSGGGRCRGFVRRRPHGADHQGQANGRDGGDADDDDAGGLHPGCLQRALCFGFIPRRLPLTIMGLAG